MTSAAAHAGPVSPEDARAAEYAELARRMRAVDAATRAARPGRSVVVVPSRTTEKWSQSGPEAQGFEERLLCLLLMLADPGLRLIYVTSGPVPEAIVGYYLGLLPRRVRSGARARLTLISAGDGSARPLAEKLLERPGVLARIRAAIPDPRLCHLAPYTATALERDIALALDVPMYAADPRHAHFGTKSGARRLFAAAGVPHPRGREHIASIREAIAAVASLRAGAPGLEAVLLKLDEGVSGEGNATLDLRGLPEPGSPDEPRRIAERLLAIRPEARDISPAAFLRRLVERGGVVEERITGAELRSPSVQLQITPAGEVAIVSTHDQLLGGAGGQSYKGCRFPADTAYARTITKLAAKVGGRLASAGVIGRSAIDFVVVRAPDGTWRPYAIELNLRKGGTTHPFATLQLLTGGRYDGATGAFTTPAGRAKHYVAGEYLESPELLSGGYEHLLGRARPGFDRLRLRGAVFHSLSTACELGRVGLTAIGDSAADAQRRYEAAHEAALQPARRVRRRRPVLRTPRAAYALR